MCAYVASPKISSETVDWILCNTSLILWVICSCLVAARAAAGLLGLACLAGPALEPCVKKGGAYFFVFKAQTMDLKFLPGARLLLFCTLLGG